MSLMDCKINRDVYNMSTSCCVIMNSNTDHSFFHHLRKIPISIISEVFHFFQIQYGVIRARASQEPQ